MRMLMKRKILNAIDTMQRNLEGRISNIDENIKLIQDSISSFNQRRSDSGFSDRDTLSMLVYSDQGSSSLEERISALDERIQNLEKRIAELERQTAVTPSVSGINEAEVQLTPLFGSSTFSSESDEKTNDQYDPSKYAANLSALETQWFKVRNNLPSPPDMLTSDHRNGPFGFDVILGIQDNMKPLYFDIHSFGPHGLIFGDNRLNLLSMIFWFLTGENKNEHLQFLLCNCTEEETAILFSEEQYKNFVLYDSKDNNGFQNIFEYLHKEKHLREQRMKESGVSSFEQYRELSLVNHALSSMPYLVVLVNQIQRLSREYVEELIFSVRQWRSLGISLIVSSDDKQLSDTVISNINYQIYIAKHAGILFSGNKEYGFFPLRGMNGWDDE